MGVRFDVWCEGRGLRTGQGLIKMDNQYGLHGPGYRWLCCSLLWLWGVGVWVLGLMFGVRAGQGLIKMDNQYGLHGPGYRWLCCSLLCLWGVGMWVWVLGLMFGVRAGV